MTAVIEEKNLYLSYFASFEENPKIRRPAWLHRIRKDAISRFSELGFPTTRHEDWQYTNVAPIARLPLKLAEYELKDLSEERLGEVSLAGLKCNQLVFINGFYSKELSFLQPQAGDVVVGSLAAALEDGGPVASHLTKYARYHDRPFVALNTAFMRDGGFVFLPPGKSVRDPIHLLFVSLSQETPAVSFPRNLIVLGAGCHATIIESYAGLRQGTYFTNAVTEIIAGDHSVIDHYKIQRESEEAFHVAALHVHQGIASNVTLRSISFGGALVRNDIDVVLDGEGAECALNGLYMVTGSQHVDNHTSIDHAKPHSTSRELYKGILDGHSSAVFDGRIVVQADAQKTNAKQTNKNLLLSEDATINTKPQLEIRADDVKCTHGATIGQLDEQAMFYMRSRGIDKETARNLLVHAFGGEIIGGTSVIPIQCQLDLIMHHRLSGVSTVKEPL
jgi:Fe-S cluster assembly protein SufD